MIQHLVKRKHIPTGILFVTVEETRPYIVVLSVNHPIPPPEVPELPISAFRFTVAVAIPNMTYELPALLRFIVKTRMDGLRSQHCDLMCEINV